VVGVDGVDHADALAEHGADVVVQDLAELLDGAETDGTASNSTASNGTASNDSGATS
jgi:hypothetical protein